MMVGKKTGMELNATLQLKNMNCRISVYSNWQAGTENSQL